MRRPLYLFIALIILIVTSFSCNYTLASGNEKIKSFAKAKQIINTTIYADSASRITLYCQAPFTNDNVIILPEGFTTEKYLARSSRLEWEHVVPAENFGRTFTAWRDGDSQCVDTKGKFYKGRRCAEKTSEEYRFMQADMYNLYPAIGAVNASRSNYNFQMLPYVESDFGMCLMKIDNRKAEPPQNARGRIARAYLYMEATYLRYRMSKSQRKLMNTWNTKYPVTSDECQRTQAIEAIQGNENGVVKEQCIANGLW